MEELIEIIRAKNQRLVPCSVEQVEELENKAGANLPAVYKQFLTTMGVSADKFMLGSSCFWDELPDLKQGAKELLLENNFKELPDNAFVFWMHQGYQFAFFIMGQGDNPTVYYYNETENQTDFRKDGSLTEFYSIQLKMSI